MAITVRKKRGPKNSEAKLEKAKVEKAILDSMPETPKEPTSKMSAEEFDKILQERIEQMQLILGNKSKEYAQDGDRLFNFRLAASINDTTMSVALWGMATKHLVSVMDLVMGRLPVSNAMVNEKIGDLINYLVLLEAILKE